MVVNEFIMDKLSPMYRTISLNSIIFLIIAISMALLFLSAEKIINN